MIQGVGEMIKACFKYIFIYIFKYVLHVLIFHYVEGFIYECTEFLIYIFFFF